MNEISREPAQTVTELASARQHQGGGLANRHAWSARWRVLSRKAPAEPREPRRSRAPKLELPKFPRSSPGIAAIARGRNSEYFEYFEYFESPFDSPFSVMSQRMSQQTPRALLRFATSDSRGSRAWFPVSSTNPPEARYFFTGGALERPYSPGNATAFS